MAAAFPSAVLAIPRVKRLQTPDHFSVDGTLIQAWASMESFKLEDEGTPPAPPEPPAGGRDVEVDFHGRRLSDDTHRSITDPEARLHRKGRGREARLCFMGHLLMENRDGLIVDGFVTEAGGHAERTAALAMIEKRADRPSRITLGADKGYDAEDFVDEVPSLNVTPPHRPQQREAALRPRRAHDVSPRLRRRPAHPLSGSRRDSAGARSSGCCAASACEAASASTWPSPSRPQPRRPAEAAG